MTKYMKIEIDKRNLNKNAFESIELSGNNCKVKKL